MNYCDSCRAVLQERTEIVNKIKNLKGILEIAEKELQELKNENLLLKGSRITKQKKKRKNNMFKLELEQSYQKIEQLQLIIQHKDMIIDNQVLNDNITENVANEEQGK
ncbi:unnamed protein product [Paramecium sonneborni]|uniref:Uncharacterized protein n=1 Tax=Paramecium sonneborni TaxID=65129 RepID=A0A8S1Q910_9CILI|nr:unnamed protein product [Paramecium sonneborni]